jgi:hypothetical protein
MPAEQRRHHTTELKCSRTILCYLQRRHQETARFGGACYVLTALKPGKLTMMPAVEDALNTKRNCTSQDLGAGRVPSYVFVRCRRILLANVVPDNAVHGNSKQ